jgi:hypothetical protein
MAQTDKRELRKFGLSVGSVFVVLGLVSWWRGHEMAPRVLWILGVLLVLPGAAAPALLGPVQRWWMAAAEALGHINARIVLTVVFYAVFTPIGFVLRLVRDPLNRRLGDESGSNWVRREPEPADPARYERQF